jgi:homopolymeric O-antigen transport system permease protein
MLKALWRYRYFMLTSIIGEFKGRFVRSRLGLFWSVVHPLAQAAIFALVLAEVLGAKIAGINDKAAYPIYLMAGLAAWGLFSEILNRCLTVFIDYASPMKKIAFPRICLPIIIWGSALVNQLLLLAAMIIVFLFFGHYPSPAWLALPLGAILISAFAFGLGMMLGIFNVFTRDVGQVLSVLLQIWFWLTPIVYMRDIVPERLRWVIEINPMSALVRVYQEALLYGRWPDLSQLAIPLIVAVSLFVMSFILFRRASPELVDAL